MPLRALGALAIALSAGSVVAHAQGIDGHASLTLDSIADATELRARLFAEYRRDVGTRVTLLASGFAEGLVADRAEDRLTHAATARPQELRVDASWRHADIRIGFSRVVWGRLDEFMPTDVVNPLDLTKFFFDGRTEGRLPVAMVRGRWLPTEKFTLESIYVPVYRRGRFDQLDEATSPFALRLPTPVEPQRPARTLRNAQGGLRAAATSGRVDWALSAYRGFEAVPIYEASTARFPRFTMVGGYFETTSGGWGIRGELAMFLERTYQVPNTPATVEGESIEGGVGFDRSAGAFRLGGNVIFAKRLVNGTMIDRQDTMLVGVIDRSFARETRSLRALVAYDPHERSTFARVSGSWNVRDNLSLESAAALFDGRGGHLFARFRDRDFFYVRVKAFF